MQLKNMIQVEQIALLIELYHTLLKESGFSLVLGVLSKIETK
jgi:hypothetical protein